MLKVRNLFPEAEYRSSCCDDENDRECAMYLVQKERWDAIAQSCEKMPKTYFFARFDWDPYLHATYESFDKNYTPEQRLYMKGFAGEKIKNYSNLSRELQDAFDSGQKRKKEGRWKRKVFPYPEDNFLWLVNTNMDMPY
ncbi:MAG: hypothetical protein V1870_01545 [Candidatus Aenigmatarchaeota archaeon]